MHYKTVLTIEHVSGNAENEWADDVTPINIHKCSLFMWCISFM